MSKEWYPVINIENCIQCGACIEMCPNGVYEKGTDSPIVINPEGCGYGCKGCQARCPASAIEYVGDTGKEVSSQCNCACGCGENSNCC